MDLRTAVESCLEGEPLVDIGKQAYAIAFDDGVALAWDADSAQDILMGGVGKDPVVADIDPVTCVYEDDSEEISDGLYRNAAKNTDSVSRVISCGVIPAAESLKEVFGGRTIFLRVAQWGGIGNSFSNSGSGIGGFGMGNTFQSKTNFDSPIVRTQFDQVLDTIRKTPKENGWDVSLETRMQRHPMYGHKRTEKDHTLEPYTLTFRERQKRKKERYLDRLFEYRNNRNKQVEDNSVAALKRIPENPLHYETVENKLLSRRTNAKPEDGQKRPPQGPGGAVPEFVQYPKAQRVAATVQHSGGGTIFAPWHENDAMIEQLLAPSKPKPHQAAGKAPQSGTTEGGLASLHSNNNPEYTQPRLDLRDEGTGSFDTAYMGGSMRNKDVPWSSKGYMHEGPNPDPEEQNRKMNYWHGDPLSVQYSQTEKNPGSPKTVENPYDMLDLAKRMQQDLRPVDPRRGKTGEGSLESRLNGSFIRNLWKQYLESPTPAAYEWGRGNDPYLYGPVPNTMRA